MGLGYASAAERPPSAGRSVPAESCCGADSRAWPGAGTPRGWALLRGRGGVAGPSPAAWGAAREARVLVSTRNA